MNIFKKILLVVLGIYVLFLLTGFLLPQKTIVTRSVEVSADLERVFKLVSEHRSFIRWSPWAAKDPNMQTRFEGPERGVGSTMTWSSAHPQVGSGESTYTAYRLNESVTTKLSFDQGGGDASLVVTELDSGNVRVDWIFETKHSNIFGRMIGFFLMESMLAPDFEYGLASLKKLAESPVQISTREISYSDGEVSLSGYIASPEFVESAPVVIVIHEWWGHNDYARERAYQLAELGYHAFAIDMYGSGKLASHPQDAQKFMMEVVSNSERLLGRFDAAMSFVSTDDVLSGQPVAAVGYCFGGAVALNMARLDKPLAGVVSFHGSLGSLVEIVPGADVPVLVLNGEDDPFVKPEHISQFEADMNAAQIPTEIIHYAGAKHSFTSKRADEMGQKFNLPLAYDEHADRASWSKMQDFLKAVFAK